MTISVNYITNVITIEKVDMTLVTTSPYEIRELDIDVVRNALRTIEAGEAGTIYPRTHNHNTEVTLGGVTYSRLVEFLAPYTITLEDGAYACNLTGANNNLVDRLNLNTVQVRANNSAGLQTVASGSGLDATQDANLTFIKNQMTNVHNNWDMDAVMRLILGVSAGKMSGPQPGQAGTVIIRDPADTKNLMEVPVDQFGYRTGPIVYNP